MDLSRFLPQKNEQPLDHILTDGGFCAIFRTIGCVGDSLASGEFESVHPDGSLSYHDMYEYSWGQFLARQCGSRVYNFSAGGMSARQYCEEFADAHGFWDPALKCQAYIIALGVNDILNQNQEYGTRADIDLSDWRNNGKTFMGYYAQIIQRLKENEPRAKFFLMTIPRDCGWSEQAPAQREKIAEIIRELAEIFSNTYVLDFHRYAPFYDRSFRDTFFLGGHMNPCGYLLTARMVSSYIDYIIRHNMEDFKEVGFICTDLDYHAKE